MNRSVDFVVGQRIVCQSKKRPLRCTVWRFEKINDDGVLSYRCSDCQADVNTLRDTYGINLDHKVSVLRVTENGELLDDPDKGYHFCKWEHSERSEEGIVHARRLIFEALMDLPKPLDKNKLKRKINEIKKDKIFSHMDPVQKAKAADIFRSFTYDKALKWLETSEDSMTISPISLAVTKVSSPPMSRMQSALSLFVPKRAETAKRIFKNVFKSTK